MCNDSSSNSRLIASAIASCEDDLVASHLTAAELEAWRSVFVSHGLVVRKVEDAFHEAELPPMLWYDLLYALYRSPGRSRRMHELADAVLMSRSGLTRLVDRIEAAGVIERRRCPTDRRGLEVTLLPDGIALLRRMWKVYEPIVAELFAANVEDPQAVARSLEPVVEALRPAAWTA
jgi:DNA-binding MarR family transcriptional regulator